MKKVLIVILSILIFIEILFNSTYIKAEGKENDTPSQWAQEEVQLSIGNDLVPVVFRKNYSKNILRGEYAVLALKTYEKLGGEIVVKEETPFIDIDGYKFENQLIKAYNAGIINGYGDKTYKPDNKITRQEISALLVQLLQAIDPNIEIKTYKNYDFNDEEYIDNWAKPYINYCYESNILKGVSELQINPKGYASLEQSIVLLFRLFKQVNNEENMDNHIVSIESSDAYEKMTPQHLNEEFITNFDDQISTIITELIKDENIILKDISSDSVLLTIDEVGIINLVKSKYEITVYSTTIDLNEETFNIALSSILSVLDSTGQTQRTYNEIKLSLLKDSIENIKRNIGEKNSLEGHMIITNNKNNEEVILHTITYHHSI